MEIVNAVKHFLGREESRDVPHEPLSVEDCLRGIDGLGLWLHLTNHPSDGWDIDLFRMLPDPLDDGSCWEWVGGAVDPDLRTCLNLAYEEAVRIAEGRGLG